MRLAIVAILVASCNGNGCSPGTGQPPVPPPTTNPPPIRADAGPPCATECARAIHECARPLISQETCAFRCTEAMANRVRVVPACEASVSVCNSKAGCP